MLAHRSKRGRSTRGKESRIAEMIHQPERTVTHPSEIAVHNSCFMQKMKTIDYVGNLASHEYHNIQMLSANKGLTRGIRGVLGWSCRYLLTVPFSTQGPTKHTRGDSLGVVPVVYTP